MRTRPVSSWSEKMPTDTAMFCKICQENTRRRNGPELRSRHTGRYRADRIVAERNNGGDMVQATIRMVDPNVALSTVWASRGKVTRAEPVSALYEQGRMHIGSF